jgi:hypothetical protein
MKMRNIIATAAMVSCVGIASNGGAAVIEMTTNGGFETGDYTGWTQFPSPLGSQTVTTVNPSSGTYAGEVYNAAGPSTSVIKQANLYAGSLTPGQSVTVSFDARGSLVAGGVAFAELFSELDGGGVSFSEILGGGPLALNADQEVWTSFSFPAFLGPDVSGGVTLQFATVTGGDPSSTARVWYDNVSVMGDVVPEPSSIILLGLGSIVILKLRSRR